MPLTARAAPQRPRDAAYLAAIRELRTGPGVGPSIADDLWRLGVREVAQLRGADPEALYGRFCSLAGGPVDRCLLYTFRCAVYYAETPEGERDPELLKWWRWKD